MSGINGVFHAGTRRRLFANGDGIEPVADVAGLSALADTRFTCGSESSTSGG